jgi:TPR repeat protein
MLGIMYGQGKGITRDGSLSLYWIKQAAKKGHIAAQKMVSKLFGMSIPPPVNP